MLLFHVENTRKLYACYLFYVPIPEKALIKQSHSQVVSQFGTSSFNLENWNKLEKESEAWNETFSWHFNT